MNKIILNLIFGFILILEYILIHKHFNNNTYYSKIGLLFLMYLVINSFNSYYIFINNGFILFIILLFYYNKELKLTNQSKLIIKNHNLNKKNSENQINTESFQNFKKLKQLKQLNEYNSQEKSFNSINLKKKKIKEKFNDKKGYNESKSLQDYKKEFEKYKFTRPVKSSIDALSKLPYFIEQFNAIWE